MKVRQYACLRVTSSLLSPGVVSERLGIPADEERLIGSHHPGLPPMPRHHVWVLHPGIDDNTAPLNDHFASLLRRLHGSAPRVRALVERGEAYAEVQAVHYLEAGAQGFGGQRPETDDDLERLGGQHRLLGFHIGRELIEYCLAAGVDIDLDEYVDEDE